MTKTQNSFLVANFFPTPKKFTPTTIPVGGIFTLYKNFLIKKCVFLLMLPLLIKIADIGENEILRYFAQSLLRDGIKVMAAPYEP